MIEGMGERLRACRGSMGLTAQRVADRVGVSQPTITRYESGRCTPSVEVFMKLVVIYRTSADYLVYGTVDGMPAAKDTPNDEKL